MESFVVDEAFCRYYYLFFFVPTAASADNLLLFDSKRAENVKSRIAESFVLDFFSCFTLNMLQKYKCRFIGGGVRARHRWEKQEPRSSRVERERERENRLVNLTVRVLTVFAMPPGLIALFTHRVIGEFGVCKCVCVSLCVCVRYNSTAENYLAGCWRLSAA